MNVEKKRKCLASIAVVSALSLPIMTSYGLVIYASIFPHVIRYMQGKYIVSASLILAIPIVHIVANRFIKSAILNALLRLSVYVIYAVFAFLMTIRSYCDPYWFGEEFDEGGASSGCVEEAPTKADKGKPIKEVTPNTPLEPSR